ncbi:MAG: CDP-alcohol phosphatidyltransferase family protein [Actinomycetota bacterium]
MSEEAAGQPPERERQLGIFEDKILTVPNVISLARLACVPVFLWLLFSQDDRWAAAWLWGGIGATDWVDGWWARKYDVVSEFGKFIDPLTDRVALIIPILAIAVDGAVPWWLVFVTLLREGLVALAGVALGAMGARRIDVTWWGKVATFGLYFAFPFLLAGASTHSTAEWFEIAGWVVVVPSLIYSYLSAAQYIPLAREALREGRLDREMG